MYNTKIVGILNLTPDSFSDGGQFYSPAAAIERIGELVRQGADVIDIGAESTRPKATPLSAEEEWQRLEPVVKQLAAFPSVPFSLDTRHAVTVKKALDYGISTINDVSGFSDPDMVEAVKNSHCKLVIMHSLTVPADTHVVMDEHVDVVAELMEFARKRIATLVSAGIGKERMIFDAGIGFGKTTAQSFAIIPGIDRLKSLDVPLYIGHSRKSFLGEPKENRDKATLEMSRLLIQQGVGYIRVHDVAAHRTLMQEMTHE